jgi:hypothetical protein
VNARDWESALHEAIRGFIANRKDAHPPVVRATLTTGEQLFLVSATSLGEELLVLAPYPPSRQAKDMVASTTPPLLMTPSVVIVRPEHVFKVELLMDTPELPERERVEFGFRFDAR